MRLLILTIVMLVFVAGGSIAQNYTSQLPPCTEAEALEVADFTTGFLSELSALLEGFQETGINDPATWVNDLEILQMSWWTVEAARFPACGLSVQAQLGIGRVIDEMLIASLLTESGRFEQAQVHAAASQTALDALFAESPPVTNAVTQPTTYYIASGQPVNARSCPSTSCSVVKQLTPGTAISVIEIVEGDVVSGSNQWQHILISGADAYVHSSLTSTQQPAAPPIVNAPPVQQESASQPAAPTAVPPPPQAGVSCGGASTCGEMASCEQAYACLAAGNSRLDRDNDGVPCESICSGG